MNYCFAGDVKINGLFFGETTGRLTQPVDHCLNVMFRGAIVHPPEIDLQIKGKYWKKMQSVHACRGPMPVEIPYGETGTLKIQAHWDRITVPMGGKDDGEIHLVGNGKPEISFSDDPIHRAVTMFGYPVDEYEYKGRFYYKMKYDANLISQIRGLEGAKYHGFQSDFPHRLLHYTKSQKVWSLPVRYYVPELPRPETTTKHFEFTLTKKGLYGEVSVRASRSRLRAEEAQRGGAVSERKARRAAGGVGRRR